MNNSDILLEILEKLPSYHEAYEKRLVSKAFYDAWKIYKMIPIETCENHNFHEHKRWYVNGKLGRLNGLPSLLASDGGKMWFDDNKLHRENGLPAVINQDGTKEWWVNGIQINHQ